MVIVVGLTTIDVIVASVIVTVTALLIIPFLFAVTLITPGVLPPVSRPGSAKKPILLSLLFQLLMFNSSSGRARPSEYRPWRNNYPV
jgi:hypothetical protein